VRTNLETLGAEAEVRRADARAFLRGASGAGRHYDLVFLDPPYRLAARLGRELSEALPAVLAPGGLAISESDRRSVLQLDMTPTDERRYGDTVIRIHGPR
jgi:16S rRNA (guanine966-N2)-methyltransferase